MISGLRPYVEMRQSGNPWIAEIPRHWELVPLGGIGRFFRGAGGTKEDEVGSGVPCVRYGDLYSKYNQFITAAASFVTPEHATDYTSIRYGDLLLAGSGETIEEIGKSAVNLLEDAACCGGDVVIFRPTRKINVRFLGYAADSPASTHQKACMGRGITVMHIYPDELRHLRIAIPPRDEQEAIVRFLDHADRRIRRAIRAKQKLIALLNEQKQAVIHRAVTRGLDPNVRLKPSGVDWLGNVPREWDVRRIGSMFQERTEAGRPELPILAVSIASGVTVVPEIDGSGRPRKLIADRALYKTAAAGDIAYNTMRMWQGAVGVAPEDGLISPAYVVCAPRAGTNSSYYAMLFRTAACRGAIVGKSRGIADDRNRLYWDAFKTLAVPAPPVDEQARIVASLEKATAATTAAIAAARRETELLREYRSRLIADAVTGELDVREAAARLPDDDDEHEPLDEADFEEPIDEDVENLVEA